MTTHEPTQPEADPLDEPPFRTADPEEVRKNVKLTRAIVGIFLMCGIYIMIAVTFALVHLVSLSEERVTTARGIETSLNKLEGLEDFTDQASSQAAADASASRLAATLKVVIEQADCNTREPIQQLVEELEDAGILEEGDLKLNCLVEPPEIPGTPTTTTPPVVPGD